MKSLPSLLHSLRWHWSRFRFVHAVAARHRRPIAFVFGVPAHSNLGDQAQTFCITEWIHRYLPRYQVQHISLGQTSDRLPVIRRFFRKDDIIICHSGYHFTDLYREIEAYLEIAHQFPEIMLRIMPQTINFVKAEAAQKAAHVLNQHGNCILLCRDAVSYETAKHLFHGCKLYLYPDVVTSLIGRVKPFNHKREGILFCMRNDVESFHSPESIEELRKKLSPWGRSDMTDTTLPISYQNIASHREQVLMKTLDKFSRYRVVITDRYHGTIFSLIAGTPVIVVNSSDHKLSSGVKWFPESFQKHVAFAASLEEVPAMVEQMMDSGVLPPLAPYFEKEYYGDKLLDTLELRSNCR